MGAFTDSLFTLLLGWIRGVFSAIMTVISSGGETGVLPFLGRNWLVIVLSLLAIGLVGDWFIWMVRWQPYRVWGTKLRRLARALHIARDEDADEDEADAPSGGDAQPYARPQAPMQAENAENIDFAPEEEPTFELPSLTQAEQAQAYAAAQDVEDAQLGDYPGMYCDPSVYMRPPEEEMADGDAAQGPEQDEMQDALQAVPDVDAAYDALSQEPQDVEFGQELAPQLDPPTADDGSGENLPHRRRRRRDR